MAIPILPDAMDDESRATILLAADLGLDLAFTPTGWPYAAGIYQGREIRIDEDGIGDAFTGPPPYGIEVRFNNQHNLNFWVAYNNRGSPGIAADHEILRRIEEVHPSRGSVGPRSVFTWLLPSHPAIRMRIALTRYFCLSVYPNDKAGDGCLVLVPACRATLAEWREALRLAMSLADAFEEHAITTMW